MAILAIGVFLVLCLWMELISNGRWSLTTDGRTLSFTNAVGRARGWHVDYSYGRLPSATPGQWARQWQWPPVLRRQRDEYALLTANVNLSGYWITSTNIYTLTNLPPWLPGYYTNVLLTNSWQCLTVRMFSWVSTNK